MSSFRIPTIKPTTFDATKLTIKPPKTNTKGLGATLVARYTHDNGEDTRFRVQTPRMIQAFDLNADKRDDGSMSYSFNLSFRGDDENPKLAEFRTMLEQMDEFNIKYATEHSQEIFGKKKSREVIEENYTTIVKYSKKPGYRPTLKVKMPMYDDKPGFQVYNKQKEAMPVVQEDGSIDLSMYSGGSEAVHLLEYTGLWQTNNKFGGSWKVVQTKMYSEPNQMAGYMMDSDSESDDEGEAAVAPTEQLIDDDDTF